MADYEIKLDVFEGPLALLMHLLEKNKVDIYDIPIAEITEQYLEHLRTLEQFNIEVASEFLVMAATLLQIKSRMLLPKPSVAAADSEDSDEGDPRQELVERLLAYQQYKQAAVVFDELLHLRQQYYTRPAQVFDKQLALPKDLKLDDLLMAFAAVYESLIVDYAVVEREDISIQDKMYDILRLLQGNKQLEFTQVMVRSHSRTEVVAAFLAVLELMRLRRIRVEQRYGFGPIYLMLKE